METVLGFVIGILAVVCAFGFIIFIHEMGHFLTARAVDIRCPQFAIGFGPSLFSFRWRGTNFAVRAFPFGGYVLMNGEEPGDRNEDDPWTLVVKHYFGHVSFPATPAHLLEELNKTPEEERAEAWVELHDQVAYARCKEFPSLQSVEGNFHDRSVGARILVISGGVIMNFLSTILILWVLGPMAGLGAFYNDWSPYLSQVVQGTPAAESGLMQRDKIVQVEGVPTETFLEAYYAIGRTEGAPVKLSIEDANGDTVEKSIQPDLRVGRQTFKVAEDGTLTLSTSGEESDKELLGKKVQGQTRESLVELVGPKVGAKEAGYELTLEGMKEPRTFSLPKDFEGARSQIGVLFGVNDVFFEKDKFTKVTAVAPGSEAEKAGFKVGDEILQIGERLDVFSRQNGLLFGSQVDRGLAAIYRVPEIEEIKVRVGRGDSGETLTLAKGSSAPTTQSLGLTLQPVATSDLLKAPFSMIGQTLATPVLILNAWLSQQYTGSEIVSNLQGPVGIMSMIFAVSDNGVAQFLFFVALLNAAIGSFNLLPFPALDGSRLVFLVIAGLRGKPINPEKEARIHMLGLMVLLGFVLVVTFGDIKRLFSADLFLL